MVNLATVVAGASLEANLVPIYYMVGILALIMGGLWTLKRYADNQKHLNIQQGNKEQQLSDKLEANTKAAEKNTASIEKLGEKFDAFSASIDKRLVLTDYRLDRLEEKVRPNGAGNIVRGDKNV